MHKPVHLVFVETKSVSGVDHNKFYDMFEVGNEVHCYYGRIQDGYEIGKTGTLVKKSISEWDKIYKSKTSKGYEDYSHIFESAITEVNSKTLKEQKLSIPAPIKTILDRLHNFAKQAISAVYKTETVKATPEMIVEAQKQLNALLDIKNKDDFNRALIQMFKIIPRSMNRVENYLAKENNIEEFEKIIAREQDLLDAISSQIQSKPVVNDDNTIKDNISMLEQYGFELTEASDEDRELAIRKLGSGIKMVNVWKVNHPKKKEDYENFRLANKIDRKDTKLLWHGTRSENLLSILKTGLVIRPTGVVISGKMFGQGIYFAPNSKKSVGYTSLSGSYWARGSSNTGFMILHEVCYGNPYIVYDFDNRFYSFDWNALKRAKADAHCLHADSSKKTMLKNDEIIIYKEEQSNPILLVEISN